MPKSPGYTTLNMIFLHGMACTNLEKDDEVVPVGLSQACQLPQVWRRSHSISIKYFKVCNEPHLQDQEEPGAARTFKSSKLRNCELGKAQPLRTVGGDQV